MINRDSYILLKQLLVILRANRLKNILVVNGKTIPTNITAKRALDLLDIIKSNLVIPTNTFNFSKSCVNLNKYVDDLQNYLWTLKGRDTVIEQKIIYNTVNINDIEHYYVKDFIFDNVRSSLSKLMIIIEETFNEVDTFIRCPNENVPLKKLLLKLNACEFTEHLFEASEDGKGYFESIDIPLIITDED